MGDWISSAEAFQFVSKVLGDGSAGVICSRAGAGLIAVRAALFVEAGLSSKDSLVPARFWFSRGRAGWIEDWEAGDFGSGAHSEMKSRAYGVSFSAGIRVLVAPAAQTKAPKSSGRPAAAWWDNLWIAMAIDLYIGDLKPKRQADIEKAMHKWLSDRDIDASESAVRSRAQKLWAAVLKEDKN